MQDVSLRFEAIMNFVLDEVAKIPASDIEAGIFVIGEIFPLFFYKSGTAR